MSLNSILSRISPSAAAQAKKRVRANRDVVVDTWLMERNYDHAHGGDDYIAAYMAALKATGSKDNFPKQNRFFTLHQMVRRIIERGVEGDIVECGCWHGHSAYIMAETLERAGWQGRLWLFDSFEGGLSDKVDEDRGGRAVQTPEQELKEKLSFVSDYERVKEIFSRWPWVTVVKGWIPDAFETADIADRRFALVHIDVDLYEPTLASLNYFGPRMSDDGVFVIDDYGAATFPGSKRAVDEYRLTNPGRFFLVSHLIGAVLLP